MSIFENNHITGQSDINSFFHYSVDHFLDVWKAYVNIFNNSLPLSGISQNTKELFFIGQPGWKNKLKSYAGTDQDQLISLLRSGNYYIDTPPLLHPAFEKTIAGILKISENDLYGLINYELFLIDRAIGKRGRYDDVINTGPNFIKTLLDSKDNIVVNQVTIKPGNLLITKVPLLPLESRKFISDIFDLGYPGVENLNYQLIAILSDKLLINEDKPTLFGIQSYKLLDQCLRELIVSIEYKLVNNKWAVIEKIQDISSPGIANQLIPSGHITEASPESHSIPEYRQNDSESDSNTPIDLICIDNSEICIQYPENIVFYNLISEKEIRNISVKKFKIHQVNSKEKIIQFFSLQDHDKHQLTDFLHYNYTSGKWFSGKLKEFNYVELSHHIESQKLINYRANTEIMLLELANYPVKKVHSACGKYLWIEDKFGNGGLYNIMSGLYVKFSADLYMTLDTEIPVFEITEFAERKSSDVYLEKKLIEEQQRNKFEIGAIVVFERIWTLLQDDVLFHNGKPIFKIDYPYSSAAFSKDGSKLFLASLLGIAIIDINRYFNDFTMSYKFVINIQNNK